MNSECDKNCVCVDQEHNLSLTKKYVSFTIKKKTATDQPGF
jgi:hypothetical protein